MITTFALNYCSPLDSQKGPSDRQSDLKVCLYAWLRLQRKHRNAKQYMQTYIHCGTHTHNVLKWIFSEVRIWTELSRQTHALKLFNICLFALRNCIPDVATRYRTWPDQPVPSLPTCQVNADCSLNKGNLKQFATLTIFCENWGEKGRKFYLRPSPRAPRPAQPAASCQVLMSISLQLE